MVISGGDFKPDALKTKEMVSLLLDDEEMKYRCKTKHMYTTRNREAVSITLYTYTPYCTCIYMLFWHCVSIRAYVRVIM